MLLEDSAEKDNSRIKEEGIKISLKSDLEESKKSRGMPQDGSLKKVNRNS